MSYAHDVFISYAHLDNRSVTQQQTGWVTRFHESLANVLSTRLGKDAAIWRDKKLQGNDEFGAKIEEAFSKTAVLISILTPRYLKSEWCNKEIRGFCETAQNHGGLSIDDQLRVFKVIKTPIDAQDGLPEVLHEVLGYRFYTIITDEDEGEAPIELDPELGIPELSQKYVIKLTKLAFDISQMIQRLEKNGDDVPGSDGLADRDGTAIAAADGSKTTVFLSECSRDQRDHRERLETELKVHGYHVVPDRRLSSDEDEYVAEVDTLLAQSDLSIHLVGSSSGVIPDGPSRKSVVVLQNEAAIRRCKEAKLKRIIWTPRGINANNPKQAAFIRSLHEDAETQYGADLITGDFEGFKTTMHRTLKLLEVSNAVPKANGDARRKKLIYLICDQRDRSATIPIRRLLIDRGFEVDIPVFEGDSSAVRKANNGLLSTCDAVLVYYGAGDEAWRKLHESDMRRFDATRDEPFQAIHTLLVEPRTDDKEESLALAEPNVIDGFDGISEAKLREFLEALD